MPPAGQLLKMPGADEIHDLSGAESREPRDLGDRYSHLRFRIAVLLAGTAANPAPLDGSAGDKASTGGVGFGVDLQPSGAGKHASGGECNSESPGRSGEFHGPAVERPDAFVLGAEGVGGFLGEVVLPTAGVLFHSEAESA